MKGTVTRVRVIVDSAFSGDSNIDIGGAVANDIVVGSTDLDLTQVGIYVIETGKDYTSAAQAIAATVTGTTMGSARVIVEYVAA